MLYFESASNYLQSQSSIIDKIKAIDSIIDALMLTAAKSAETDHIDEYQLNDGQTVIKTKYTGTAQVYNSIRNFERLRNMYLGKIQGNVVRLVDSRNFTNGRY